MVFWKRDVPSTASSSSTFVECRSDPSRPHSLLCKTTKRTRDLLTGQEQVEVSPETPVSDAQAPLLGFSDADPAETFRTMFNGLLFGFPDFKAEIALQPPRPAPRDSGQPFVPFKAESWDGSKIHDV